MRLLNTAEPPLRYVVQHCSALLHTAAITGAGPITGGAALLQ